MQRRSKIRIIDVFSALIRKLGQVLAVALTLGLALGAISAQAQTVEMEGDTATAIRDLELNGVTYDVVFDQVAAPGLYGDPPVFDFLNAADAKAAVQAVNDVFNAQGNVLNVGSPGEQNVSPLFRIAYDVVTEELFDKTLRIPVDVTLTFAGDTPDTGSPGLWVTSPDPSEWLFITDARYADFTIVGTPGSGNQPPTAEAGASVTGEVGTAVSFDGSASSDPEGPIARYDWDFGDGTTNFNGGPTPSNTYAVGATYNVILRVTDGDGAVDSDTTTAVIGAASQPPVAATGGPYDGTEGVLLGFNGSGSDDPDGDIVQYDWNFGDGNTAIDGGLTPSNTYAASGEYTVTLTVTDDDSETGTDFTTATIGAGNQPPTADAGPPVIGTSGVAVEFDGSDSDDPEGAIASYDWDFGDGGSDTVENPSYVYGAPGDYTVILTVADADGVMDSDTTAASIDPAPIAPVADANGPYQGVVDLPIGFDGSGSDDWDGTIVSWDWGFGDGNNGTGETPSHSYAADGFYTVTLTVTDDDGLMNTDTTTTSVATGNQPPTADANGPYSGVAGAPVAFDGSASDDDGTIVSWEWDFGDGNSGTGETPSNSYAAEGIYAVTLTVTDDDGVMDTTETGTQIYAANQPPTADSNGPYTGAVSAAIAFDGSASKDDDGTIVSWDWDFGDGGTDTVEKPSYSYAASGNYNVTLTVIDDDGASSSEAFSTASIDSANEPPVADANGPYTSKIGVAVSFDANDSDDTDGDIVQYDWYFADGTSAIDGGPTPTHIYDFAKAYEVVLVVTDNDGSSALTEARAIIVPEVDVNLSPTADANGPYTGEEAVALAFDGTGSDDRDGTITQYAWDFGDGNVGSGLTPINTYAAAGSYLVTLMVTDDGGATDTQTVTASIDLGNQLPTADAGGPYPGAVNQPVQLNGTGSDDADGHLVAAQWDFGDGTAGSGLAPTHTYTAPGTYTATLTVTDNEGGTDTASTLVIVGDGLQLPPTADADGPYIGVAAMPVPFDGSGSSDPDGTINNFAWAFGDGNTGNGIMPDNTYGVGGVYNVALEVTDDDVQTASDSTVAIIGDLSLPPTADANGPYNGSVGNPITFDGADSNDPDGTIVQYDWDFGDDNTAIDGGPSPTNAYAVDGIYIVRLTVMDDSGETDEDVTDAQIGIGNLPPVADAGPAATGATGIAVSFDGSGSGDPDGIITQYEWEFGDGNTGTGPTPQHIYDVEGTYFVTLTVTDNDEATSSDATLATVTDPADQIRALIEQVKVLGLTRGTEKSLIGKLETALKKLEGKNPNGDQAAINVLRAFINEVKAHAGKKIPRTNAEALIGVAEEIIDTIENGVGGGGLL